MTSQAGGRALAKPRFTTWNDKHPLTRAAISGQCPDYDLLGDIVNAAKHRSLTRGTPQISNATQIEEQIVVTEYEDEHGPYRCVEKVVVVGLANGSARDVLEVLTNVMNFWQGYLHSIGVLANPRNYPVPHGAELKSRSECGDSRLNFEMARGLRFRQTVQLQKYNYVEGKIEPVDLTGKDVRFKIHPRPRQELTLSLKSATGQEFSKTIILSEDESEALDRLTTDHEKQTYVQGLPLAQQTVRELAIEAKVLEPEPEECQESS